MEAGIPTFAPIMSANPQLQKLVDAQARGQLGFIDKVLAWWEGYDLSGVPKKGKKDKRRNSGQANDDDEPVSVETMRLELSEQVWGNGFCGPWDAKLFVPGIKLTGLPEANNNIAFIGADVGGPALDLAAEVDGAITIYEEDEWKASLAELRIAQADMASRITVEQRPILDLDLEPRSLGAIVCRDRFFEIADTYPVLKHFEEALVPLGHLVISDYVMNRPEDYKELIDKWIDVEPGDLHLWSIEDYQDNLRDLKLMVRQCEDVSNSYKAMIVQAWAAVTDAVPDLMKREGSEVFLETLDRDAQFWNHRWDALHNPGICNYVIHALKPNSGKSMSDW